MLVQYRISTFEVSMGGAAKKFSRIVRARRQKLGLSQEELAEKAEIDRTYVSLIERGKRKVTINVAERIAEA